MYIIFKLTDKTEPILKLTDEMEQILKLSGKTEPILASNMQTVITVNNSKFSI